MIINKRNVPGPVVRIVPPLNIVRPLVEEGLAIFEEALMEAEQTTAR